MLQTSQDREYDFALVIDGVADWSPEVADALFEAGCDDATFSVQYGRLYAEFSRVAKSPKDAILSAIGDVRKAKVGAVVLRVDDTDLVTPSDVARRIGRSRQMVHQYMTGARGPGDFPAPECHLSEGAPLWTWCAVSEWLARNDIIRAEEGTNAEVVATINVALEAARQHARNPKLVKEVTDAVNGGSARRRGSPTGARRPKVNPPSRPPRPPTAAARGPRP